MKPPHNPLSSPCHDIPIFAAEVLRGVNGRLILGRLADQALLVREGHVGRGDAVAWYWMLDVKVGRIKAN